MKLAKLNQHGVATRGVESVAVRLPKAGRCRAIVRLAQLKDGWRFGYDYGYSLGGGGAAPSANGQRFPSRDLALQAGLARVRRHLDEAANYHKSETNAVRAVKRGLAIIDQFIAQQFPKEPSMSAATLEKSNGHKLATKTRPHTKSHEAPEPPARRRKEDDHLPTDGSNGSSSAGGPVALSSAEQQRAGKPEAPKEVLSDSIVKLRLDQLSRHPDNRVPSKEAIAALAESMRDGQLEPIIVRTLTGPTLDEWVYQVLSGETRWLAAQQLGWKSIAARIFEFDDAKSLEILAAANAQRTDLTPIEKARLIQRLTQPREEGGAGMTLAQAGRIYGLESGGAASNLVRLLQLPETWQQRVASGELAWTWAREIVPFAGAKAVLEELNKDWADRNKQYGAETFHSRQELLRGLTSIAEEQLRPVDRASFKTSDHADELGIIELPLTDWNGKARTRRMATNVERFDELQKAADEAKAKGKAEKAGRDESPAKKPATREELRQKAADRGKQLADHVAGWRDKLLRDACIRALEEGRDDGLKLLLAYIPQTYRGAHLSTLIEKATKKKHQSSDWCGYLWNAVGELDAAATEDLLRNVACQILAQDPDDYRRPLVAPKLVDAYAAHLDVDVAEAWIWLQAAAVPDAADRRAMLERFFLIHRTEELQELAGELGVHALPSIKTRAALVKLLLSVPQGTTRRLPLPKSIRPLAAAKTKKTRRGK